MATETLPAPGPKSPCNDPQTLQQAIKDIDGYSQTGLSEISALAKVSLAWLETPRAHFGNGPVEGLAHILQAIWTKAETVQDTINCEAGDVGCAYWDDAQSRRYEAWRAAESARTARLQGEGHV